MIPDFVGYIVMTSGLFEMARECTLFMKVKPYVTGMSVYTGILYILNIFSVSVSLGALTSGQEKSTHLLRKGRGNYEKASQ